MSVWLYDIIVGDEAGRAAWHVRGWPQDAPTPEDSGEWYDVVLTEFDPDSIRVHTIRNNLDEAHQGRGFAPALYPVVARRLGKRLLSSRSIVSDSAESRNDRATEIWEYLVSIGEAEVLEPDVFVIDGRPGHAGPTRFGPLPERPAPSNDAEFQSLMEEVDRRLQDQNIPIPGRQLMARAEVSKILASQLSPLSTKRAPNAGVYEGDDLVIRMDEWIANRYGDRLLVDFSRGRVAVLLRGAVWVMNLPWLLGRWRLIASRTIPSDKPEMRAYRADDPEEANRPIPVHNVVESLVALPEGLKQDLTDDELRQLLFAFDTGIQAFEALRAVQQTPYIREAIADHLAAADHLSAPATAHPGLAKWAALQAVEKTYKAFLTARHADFPPTHLIKKLSKLSAKVGLHPADPQLIAEVECKASVRYGDPKVTLVNAVAAHHAALDLSWYVAEEIRGAPISAP